jgi:NAD(P)-dependent dehydrogenase (short-subunit alcohol dehydrogenase family)
MIPILVLTGVSAGIGAAVLRQLCQQNALILFTISRRGLALDDASHFGFHESIMPIPDSTRTTTKWHHPSHQITIYHFQGDLCLSDTPLLFFSFIQSTLETITAEQTPTTTSTTFLTSGKQFAIHALFLSAATVEPLALFSSLDMNECAKYCCSVISTGLF